MKKSTKRLLAAVLSVVMILGALPLTALADGDTGGGTAAADVVYGFYNEDGEWTQDGSSNGTAVKDEEGYVTLTKTATKNNDGTYTVNLGVELKMKTEPSATALVIDLSNSMDDCVYCGKEEQSGNTVDQNKCTCSTTSTLTYQEIYSQSYEWDDPVIRRDGEYYIKNSDGTYQRVYHCSEGHWVGPVTVSYDCWFTAEDHSAHSSSNRVTPKSSVYDYNSNHRQFYYAVGQTSNTDKFVSRLDKTKEAAKSFLKIYSGLEFNSDGSLKTTANQNLGRYISIVQFGTNARTKKINDAEWVDVSNPSNYTAAVTAIDDDLGTKFGLGTYDNRGQENKDSGGTNMDAGLRKAQGLMSWNSPKTPATAELSTSNKNVVVLSDGTPTYYVKTGDNGNTTNQSADGNEGCPKSIEVTEATAGSLKTDAETVAGSTVYTVCFGKDVSASKCWNKKTDRDNNARKCTNNNVLHDDTTKTVGDFLTNVATDMQHFYDATDAEQLMSAFAKVAENVVKGLNSGVVLDTLPSGVTVSGSSGFENSQKNWALNPTDVKPTTDDDGFKHYKYTTSYVVSVTANNENTIDVGGEGYVLLNGTTTFTGGGHTYGFPIPAVRVETAPTTAAVTINKTFSGLADDDTLPEPTITISKQTDDGTYGTGTQYTLTGNATDGYTFGSDIALGAGTYKLTESSYTVDGYSWTGSLAGGTAVTGEDAAWTFTVTDSDITDGKNLTLANSYSRDTVTVTFIVENGTWINRTEEEEKTNYSIEIEKGGKLTEKQIPAATPDEGYVESSGDWVDSAPGTATAINEDVTYTYKYSTQTSTGTLTAEGGEWTYDGEAHAATAIAPEGYTVYYKVGEGEWTTDAPSVTNVSEGEVTVSVKATKTGYTDLTCNDVTLKINPRAITITVNDASKTYGASDPEFTGSITSGALVNENDLGTISYKRTNTDEEAVRTYEDVLDADYTENGNYNVTVGKGTFTITAAPAAVLTVAKEVTSITRGQDEVWTSSSTSEPTAEVGDMITWTITVTNTGNAEGKFTLADVLSKTNGATTTSQTLTSVSPALGADETYYTVPAKADGVDGTKEFTVTYTVAETDNNKTLKNTVTVTPEGGDPTEGSSGEITVDSDPALSVTKTVYSIKGTTNNWTAGGVDVMPTAQVGDTIVWKIVVTNSGKVSGTASLTDTLTKAEGETENLTTFYSNVACTTTATDFAIPAKSGNTNGSKTYFVKYTVAAADAGKTLSNGISLDGEEFTPSDEKVNVGQPDLSVTKKVYSVAGKKDSTVNPNGYSGYGSADKIPTAKVDDVIIWYIEVTNKGNAAGEFNLTDSLIGAGCKFYSDEACTNEVTGWPQTIEGGNYGEHYYVKYTVTEKDIGKTLVNTVVMKQTGEEDKTGTSDGVPVGGLTVEKKVTKVGDQEPNYGGDSVTIPDAKVGDTITWTITVKNYFDTDQTFTLTDELTGGRDVALGTPNGGTLADGKYTIPAATDKNLDGSIEPTVMTITATYVVQESDEGTTLTNKVVIKNDGGNKIDDGTAPGVEVEGKLSVRKYVETIVRGGKTIYSSGATLPEAKIGDKITWEIMVTNTGSAAIQYTLADVLEGRNDPLTIYDGNNDVIDPETLITIESRSDEEPVFPYHVYHVEYTVKTSDYGAKLINVVTATEKTDDGTDKTHTDKAEEIKVEDKPNNTPSYNPNYNAGVQLEKGEHFNYVIGYSDGTVRPEGNITRAEVATIFFRLLTDESRKTYLTEYNTFTDVEKSMWHNVAISTLARAGVLNGYNDGSFRPDNNITRAEMAAIISRFAELEGSTRISFTDIRGHWAEKSILLAASNGWINGYNDGSFRPDQNITRAETFAMINRVLERKVEHVEDLVKDMNTWVDNMDTTQWYYFDVQEATNYHSYQRKYTNTNAEKWIKKLTDIDWTVYQY